MKQLVLIPLLSLFSHGHAVEPMVLGDGRIDGERIAPYSLTWQQCTKAEDGWQSSGSVSETLITIGDAVLRHRQSVEQANEIVVQSDTFFDRKSFRPLRLEAAVSRDGKRIAGHYYSFTADGYTGVAEKGDEQTSLQGAGSSGMLHGMVMGLPLAAISPPDKPIRFLASMVSFDGTYDVVATWSGHETLEIDEHLIRVEWVDVEWHHRETGDVYPAGPDASGGRYWLINEPPAGIPYVLRYQTDSYAVEFLPSVCPDLENPTNIAQP